MLNPNNQSNSKSLDFFRLIQNAIESNNRTIPGIIVCQIFPIPSGSNIPEYSKASPPRKEPKDKVETNIPCFSGFR